MKEKEGCFTLSKKPLIFPCLLMSQKEGSFTFLLDNEVFDEQTSHFRRREKMKEKYFVIFL